MNETRTHVLFLGHTAAPSGAELALLRLATAMENADVTVALAEKGPLADGLRDRGIEVLDVSGRFESRKMTIGGGSVVRLLAGVWALAKLGWTVGGRAKSIGATVIVAETTKALLMGVVASRRARIPLVWHVHDLVTTQYFGRILATLVRTLGWTVSAGYIANSRATLASLVTWRRRSLVGYPGVDLSESLTDSVRRVQPAAEDTVVSVVGRLTEWKGQHVFLRALAGTAVPPREVYLVGGTFFDEEYYRTELEELALELDVSVTFVGHVSDPMVYMRKSDVVVHCSVLAEPFGQVVVEAMSAGCAVIASTPGGTTEIVTHGVDGLLVEGGDVRQLTSALDTVIGNRALRQRLSDAAPARAARFDIRDTARAVELFLDELSGTSSTRVDDA